MNIKLLDFSIFTTKQIVRFGLFFTLFFHYIFLFFGPSGWQYHYLYFTHTSQFLNFNPWLVGTVCLSLLFVFQIKNLLEKPWPILDILNGCLLIVIKNESIFAHCHWSEIMPFVFFLLAINTFQIQRNKNFNLMYWIRILVSLIYFSSVTQRLLDPFWQNGDFIKLFLESPVFSKWTSLQYFLSPPVEKFLTFSILFIEVLGILLPFRKLSRPIVLLLLPLHIYLLFFSTESVWQVLFIFLLLAIYVDSKKSIHLETNKFLFSKFCIKSFVILIYFAAVPYSLLLPWFMPVVKGARSAIDAVYLTPLYNQRLFYTKPYISFCPQIFKYNSKNQIEKVYSNSVDQCVNQGQGIVQDHLYHSLLQYYLNAGAWNLKNNHREDAESEIAKKKWIQNIQQSWAQPFCSSQNLTVDPESEYLIFALLGYSHQSKLIIQKQALVSFNCAKGSVNYQEYPSPKLSEEVENLAREYRQHLESKKSNF